MTPTTVDRRALFDDHIHVARIAAARAAQRYGRPALWDDLHQEALAALWTATGTWEPGRGTLFRTWACDHCTWAVLEWMRRQDHLSRKQRAAQRDTPRAQWASPLSVEQLHNEVGWDPEQTVHPQPEDAAVDADTAAQVRHLVDSLPPRDRDVIVDRYWRGLTWAAIGDRVGLTESGAYQRAAAVLRRMRGWLSLIDAERAS